ncbi:DUF5799 family protein [Halococcus salsus]|nr:DUF5799 family protein [Halococcus salsus]
MSTRAWGDMIAGDRMAVDREFEGEIEESEFNRQQWGLVMTAVEFEIENPEDPDRARLVADTSKLGHVMGELDNLDSPNAMGGGGGSGNGGSGGGVVDSIKSSLGLGGGGGNGGRRAAAAELTERYAEQLQAHLESNGKWERVRTAAAN